jgi:hypothetical protein
MEGLFLYYSLGDRKLPPPIQTPCDGGAFPVKHFSVQAPQHYIGSYHLVLVIATTSCCNDD